MEKYHRSFSSSAYLINSFGVPHMLQNINSMKTDKIKCEKGLPVAGLRKKFIISYQYRANDDFLYDFLGADKKTRLMKLLSLIRRLKGCEGINVMLA